MSGLTHTLGVPAAPSRVVVLGAGGFVGGAILRRLGAERVATAALGRPGLDLTRDGAAESLAAELRPADSVVFVSAVAPTRSADDLVRNTKMVATVCAALTAHPVAHLVYLSSDAVYPDAASPVDETTPAAPASLHGAMHLARETALRGLSRIPTAMLRPSLIYGAADPHNGYGPNRFRRLAAKGEAITLFGNGEERRDHVAIDDVAEIAWRVLARRSAGILNVATGVSTSFRDVAEMTAALAQRPVEIKPTPRQTPVTHRHFDVTAGLRAFPDFRYMPLADGLARAYADALEVARG
jgi:nucleoside-diphosphate-sugar epimerase